MIIPLHIEKLLTPWMSMSSECSRPYASNQRQAFIPPLLADKHTHRVA